MVGGAGICRLSSSTAGGLWPGHSLESVSETAACDIAANAHAMVVAAAALRSLGVDFMALEVLMMLMVVWVF